MAIKIAAVVDTNEGKVVNAIVADAAVHALNGFLLVDVVPLPDGGSPVDHKWSWVVGVGLVAPIAETIPG